MPDSAPQPPAAPSTTQARRRNETIDAIRVFAAAGIVFVHAVEAPFFDTWGNLFRFGVPFFLFASLYYQSLSLRRNPDRPLPRFIAQRFARLYLPFLVWSVIYLLVRDAERLSINHLPPVRLRLSMLWTGTEYHLWFLPFLLAWVTTLASLYYGLVRRDRRLRWLIIAVAITAGCIAAARPAPQIPDATLVTYDDPAITYAYWQMSLPAGLGALAFACLMAMGPTISAVPVALGGAGFAMLAICSYRQVHHGIELAPRALTGLGSMLVALAPWKSSLIPPLARLGRRGYGIYLCHVIPVEIIHTVFHHLHLGPSPWLDVANFVLSFVGACAIVMLLEKSPKTAWLNG